MQTLGTADVFDGTSAKGRTLDARKPLDQVKAVRWHPRPAGADDQADRRRVAVARLVPYYLRSYALPPDPVFVDHIRQCRYQARPLTRPGSRPTQTAVSGGDRRLAAG